MAESQNICCALNPPGQVWDEKDCLIFVEKDGKFCGFNPVLLSKAVPSCFRGFIICNVCEGIMRGACGVGDPQVFMCAVCASGDNANPLPPNRDLIMEMTVDCPLKSRGCEWEGTLSSVETHMDSCDYFLIDCHQGCGIVTARVEMETHLTELCVNRKVICDYCSETYRVSDTNIHLEVCVEFPLRCSNECGIIIPRKDMQSHAEDMCPNTPLECEYKIYGCDARVTRKDLDAHKNEARLQHMEIMMQSGIQSLNEELDKVNQENMLMKQQFDSVIGDNLVQKNILCDLTNEYTTLKWELNALKSDTQKRCKTLKNNHSTFVNETFGPLANRVEVLEKKNASLEVELAGKVSTVEPLTSKCKEIEFLSLFHHKRTFKVTNVIEKGPKCLSENWEELRRNTTRILKINYEVISSVDQVLVRFTGVFSVREHGYANVTLCIVLMNYDRNSIHKLYRCSGALSQEDTESVSDLPIQGAHRPRSSSQSSRSKKAHKTVRTLVLADIPMEDIMQEVVCVDNCIFIQVYYGKEENESF